MLMKPYMYELILIRPRNMVYGLHVIITYPKSGRGPELHGPKYSHQCKIEGQEYSNRGV